MRVCVLWCTAHVSHTEWRQANVQPPSALSTHWLLVASVVAGTDRQRRRRYWRQGQARTAEATAAAAAGVETGVRQCLQISTGLTQEDSGSSDDDLCKNGCMIFKIYLPQKYLQNTVQNILVHNDIYLHCFYTQCWNNFNNIVRKRHWEIRNTIQLLTLCTATWIV